jgi:hypothetical protein
VVFGLTDLAAADQAGREADEVPVLIVGGSLVGLSTALFLAHHGVPSLSVERHSGTAIHPRAGHFQLRTLELLRTVGLEDIVRRTSEESYFPNGGISAMESVRTGEIAVYVGDLNEGVQEFSPSRRLFVAQDALEPILRERATELGATVRYGAEVASVQEVDDGVTAEIRDRASGEIRTVRARYLVAADGWRSPIREQLGIGMHGYGQLSRSATIYFRADCAELLEGTNLGVIYVFNPRLRGFFRFERSGNAGFLAVNTLGDPREPGALDVTKDLTPERAVELVRIAIGVPDIPVIVDDVSHWEATADVAGDDLPQFIDDLWIEIGYRYRSTAVIAEGDDDGALIQDPRVLAGRPGTRAPGRRAAARRAHVVDAGPPRPQLRPARRLRRSAVGRGGRRRGRARRRCGRRPRPRRQLRIGVRRVRLRRRARAARRVRGLPQPGRGRRSRRHPGARVALGAGRLAH